MDKKSFNPWGPYSQIVLGVLFLIQFFIDAKSPTWFNYLRLSFGIGIIVFALVQLRKRKNF